MRKVSGVFGKASTGMEDFVSKDCRFVPELSNELPFEGLTIEVTRCGDRNADVQPPFTGTGYLKSLFPVTTILASLLVCFACKGDDRFLQGVVLSSRKSYFPVFADLRSANRKFSIKEFSSFVGSDRWADNRK